MALFLTLKILHLASVISWFAGLFYLPRLFVYHVEHPEAAPTLTIMERKLAMFIMGPAAIATAVTGAGLIWLQPEILQTGWLNTKLLLVLILFNYHASLEIFRHRLATNKNTRSGRFFRMYNEIPTLLMLAILTLAIAKPF